MDAVEAALDRGQRAFDAADYQAAIESFEDALRALPEDASGGIRRLTRRSLGNSLQKAFDVGGDVTLLKRRAELLRLEITSTVGSAAVAQLERQLAEIDAQVEHVERVEREKARVQTPTPREPIVIEKVVARPVDRPARVLTISGAVATGVGVAGLAIMGVGLGLGARAERDGEALAQIPGEDLKPAFDDGRRANTIAMTGGIAGGALLVAGVALLTAGVVRQRRKTSSSHLASIRPTGVGFSAQF